MGSGSARPLGDGRGGSCVSESARQHLVSRRRDGTRVGNPQRQGRPWARCVSVEYGQCPNRQPSLPSSERRKVKLREVEAGSRSHSRKGGARIGGRDANRRPPLCTACCGRPGLGDEGEWVFSEAFPGTGRGSLRGTCGADHGKPGGGGGGAESRIGQVARKVEGEVWGMERVRLGSGH